MMNMTEMEPNRTPRIVLVDDHALFRNGLRGLLEGVGGCQVVAEAASGEEFLTLLPGLSCDVVFMDISMPGIDGAETTRRALARCPSLRIVSLSMFGDRQYYTRMVDAGVCGFLLKDSTIDEVTEAIRAVMEGENCFPEALLATLSPRTHAETLETETAGSDALSSREQEILTSICSGLSNQEIAEQLFISKRTVDKHRANILEKTGCKNTASLVVYAIRNRLIDL